MNDNDPKYYRYLILFNEDVQDADPILHISDMNKLKAMNEGRMHLFDDALNAILPAVEYCFHMPRTELDTYDTDTEVLDKAYDVPQDIFIMPDSRFPSVDIGSSFTCIIYSESCREEVKQKARNSSCELGAVSIEELSQSLLVEQWNKLFENRNFRNETKLEDIDKQYLLTEEKQMALPLLFTARQYGKADEVYGKVFNSLDIFETCAKLLWNQTVHHNALMHCKDFEGEEQERFRKLYVEGLEEAEKKSKINIVITMPGVPQNQINYGGLEKILPENEKKVIKLLGIHRAIAKGALLIELPPVEKELFEKLNELEIKCKHKTNNKYVHKALREALANCLVHADYYGRQGLVIIKKRDSITMSNPGSFRIEVDAAKSGGVSDPRNGAMLKMFNLIDIGERAGSGIPNIFRVWREQNWTTPEITEQLEPERTILSLVFEKASGKKQAIKASNHTIYSRQKQSVIEYLTREIQADCKTIADLLEISSPRARAVLTKMVKEEIIITEGGNRNRTYKLKS